MFYLPPHSLQSLSGLTLVTHLAILIIIPWHMHLALSATLCPPVTRVIPWDRTSPLKELASPRSNLSVILGVRRGPND